MNTRDLLKAVPLFSGMTVDDLEQLSDKMVARSFSSGSYVCRQGDSGAAMYVIAKGIVQIVLTEQDHGQVLVQQLGDGEYFGELSLFDAKPRSASAICVTDVMLLELDRSLFAEFLMRHPQAALALLSTFSERLRNTNELLTTSVSKDIFVEADRKLGWCDRFSDKIAGLNGSWWFISGLLMLTVTWIVLNSGWFKDAFDPYPYQFFNLFLAILVALQGPLIMMSQNREAIFDRASATNDYQVNLKNEMRIEVLLKELLAFRAETAKRFETIDSAIRVSQTRDICNDKQDIQ